MCIEASRKEELTQLALCWLPEKDVSNLSIHRDTSDFFKVEYGDIVLLNQTPYLIRHNAREERHGLDDVKHWVKRAVDLITLRCWIISSIAFARSGYG